MNALFSYKHFLISTLKQYQINKNLSSEFFCSNPLQLFQTFSLNTHFKLLIVIFRNTITMSYMILQENFPKNHRQNDNLSPKKNHTLIHSHAQKQVQSISFDQPK